MIYKSAVKFHEKEMDTNKLLLPLHQTKLDAQTSCGSKPNAKYTRINHKRNKFHSIQTDRLTKTVPMDKKSDPSRGEPGFVIYVEKALICMEHFTFFCWIRKKELRLPNLVRLKVWQNGLKNHYLSSLPALYWVAMVCCSFFSLRTLKWYIAI